MITKDEAKALYEGKHFYEIVTVDSSRVVLAGPLDNIRYVNKTGESHNFSEYEFLQIIDGIPVMGFRKNEILITDRIL